MHFLRVNVMFHDTVNRIHHVITTANPFPYTAKFMLDSARNKYNSTNETLKDE